MKSFKEYYLLNEKKEGKKNLEEILKEEDYNEALSADIDKINDTNKLKEYLDKIKQYAKEAKENQKDEEEKYAIDKIEKINSKLSKLNSNTEKASKGKPKKIKKNTNNEVNTNNNTDNDDINNLNINTKGIIAPEEAKKMLNNIVKILNKKSPVSITSKVCTAILNKIKTYTNDNKLSIEDLKRAFAFSDADQKEITNAEEQLNYILEIVILISLYNKYADSAEQGSFFTSNGEGIRKEIDINDNLKQNITKILKLKTNFKSTNILNDSSITTYDSLKNAIKKISNELLSSNKAELYDQYTNKDIKKGIQKCKTTEELNNYYNEFSDTQKEEHKEDYETKLKELNASKDRKIDGETPPADEEAGEESDEETPPIDGEVNGKTPPANKTPTDGKAEKDEASNNSPKRFRVYFRDPPEKIEQDIDSYFGVSNNGPEDYGSAVNKALERLNNIKKETTGKQEAKDKALERAKRKVTPGEVSEDFVNGIIEGNLLNEARPRTWLKTHTPTIGRVNSGDDHTEKSWDQIKQDMLNYRQDFANKVNKIFDRGKWATTSTKDQQQKCFKINLLSSKFETKLNDLLIYAKKKNSYSELGKMRYDAAKEKEAKKDKKEDKFRNSAKGKSEYLNLKDNEETIKTFMDSYNKMPNSKEKEMIAYAIRNPKEAEKYKDPITGKTEIINRIREYLVKGGNELFQIKNLNIDNIKKIFYDAQKKYGNSEELSTPSAKYKELIDNRVSNNIAIWFKDIAEKNIEMTEKNYQEVFEKEPETKTETGSKVVNSSVITNEKTSSIVTENILYKKYVLREANIGPASVKPDSDVANFKLLFNKTDASKKAEALNYFASKAYKTQVPTDKEKKAILKAFSTFIMKNGELAKKWDSYVNGKLYQEQKRKQEDRIGKIKGMGKEVVQGFKDAGSTVGSTVKDFINKKIENHQNKINQSILDRKRAEQNEEFAKYDRRFSVTTGAVGNGVIPDRLYRKIIRRRIKK